MSVLETVHQVMLHCKGMPVCARLEFIIGINQHHEGVLLLLVSHEESPKVQEEGLPGITHWTILLGEGTALLEMSSLLGMDIAADAYPVGCHNDQVWKSQSLEPDPRPSPHSTGVCPLAADIHGKRAVHQSQGPTRKVSGAARNVGAGGLHLAMGSCEIGLEGLLPLGGHLGVDLCKAQDVEASLVHVHSTSLPPFVIATGVITLDEAIHILEQDLYHTWIREKQRGISMPGTVIRIGCLLSGHPWSPGWLRCTTSPC